MYLIPNLHSVATLPRLALAVFVAALLSGAAAAEDAQDYPSRPVQLIVPTTVGGGADSLARLFGQKLTEELGQATVVNNVPGAGGLIGVKQLVASKPDGYALLFGFNQLTTMNPSLLGNAGYDVDKDLVPVTMLAEQPYVWIANLAFPPNTLSEWIVYAKANPDKVAFAHNGTGSAANLLAEMFMQSTGTQMLGVAYKNNATPDLLAGVVQLKLEPASVALPLLQAGKVKALAVTSTSRMEALPQVPSMTEFFPGNAMSAVYSIWAPAGTPQTVISRLNDAFGRILLQTAFVAQLKKLAVTAVGSSPAQLRESTRKEYQMLSGLVKSRKIKVEP